jgi:transcriptional accessory protein Tex/SPT6
MLGRGLRSQVAQCTFEYDATKLVAELQRVAAGLNRSFEDELRQLVLEHEASIREAAESAWWDDLHERASARLVGITADHLSRQVNRGAVDAKVVLAIDAVGPRTAATAIVSADGQLLHCEDLPCQLSASQRGQAVNKMGELIHTYHVDLLVISNGPARRATMIALNDLISQSPPDTVRWTLADRSGADAYASSGVANDEMRSTPRRFRAAAWLAFSVLQPAQALAKVDPLKLRLSSFQRELSDDALADALTDVMTSGASRGGVDANSAPISWLQKLPGISAEMATTIDQSRREKLFNSRQTLLDLEQWETAANSRQAITL